MVYIQISGGSITNRYLLSTNQFNLSLYLSKLGYNMQDISDSIFYANTHTSKDLDSSTFKIRRSLVLSIIKHELSLIIKNIDSKLNLREQDIKNLTSKNSSLKAELSNFISLKEQKKRFQY